MFRLAEISCSPLPSLWQPRKTKMADARFIVELTHSLIPVCSFHNALRIHVHLQYYEQLFKKANQRKETGDWLQ